MRIQKLADIKPWDERNQFATKDMAMATLAMDQEINELRRALATSEQRIAELEDVVPTHVRLAELLISIGWTSACDAQWTHLRAALPQIKAML